MVGKFVGHAGDSVFWHVAVHAVARSNRAGGPAQAGGCRTGFRRLGAAPGRMAGKTFLVVSGCSVGERLVRVVAGEAGDVARCRPALAVLEPLGLEPDVLDTAGAQEFHVHPGAVAGAAEIERVLRAELVGIEDERALESPGLHRGHVPRARTVASLAGDARDHAARVELVVRDRRRGVTAEAQSGLPGIHGTPEGLFERARK